MRLLAVLGTFLVWTVVAIASTATEVVARADVVTVHSQQAGTSWSVTLDRAQLSTTIGSDFSFTSTLRNASGQPLAEPVAYLNVFSVGPGVYVDPEDWSSQRTQYLTELAPREARSLHWTVKAVNSGDFVVYVVATTRHGSNEIATSPALRVHVTHQRTLNPAGVLPVVLAVPALAGLATALTFRRRRSLG
jgi:hypothetical protein